MSRSGYDDDYDGQWALIRWRGAVQSAIRGKRGQAFLNEMRDAMDALPEKRLVAMELEAGAEVCAIGSVGRARGVDMSRIDPEDYQRVARTFGISEALAQEIVYMNDERCIWSFDDKGRISGPISPEERFAQMRAWIDKNITSKADAP